MAGMVLNDLFDYEIDCQERPERPLPSGRISLQRAKIIGWSMLGAGVALGTLAGGLEMQWRSGLVAAGLVVAIVAYDRWLKHTPVGPLGMGACRLLNVLLGMSTLAGDWEPLHYGIASSMGLYIVGVTWLARTEAEETSQRMPLLAAASVMTAAIVLLALRTADLPFAVEPLWWLVIGGSVVYRALWAAAEPESSHVQRAVKHGILSIVVLDALVALSACGQPATAIMLLLLPAVMLGRWIYST
jgi:4-hydroxybenzoate polyprenyltransferase